VVTAYLPTYNVHAITYNTIVLVFDIHSHIDSDTVLLVLAPCGSGLCDSVSEDLAASIFRVDPECLNQFMQENPS